MQRIAFLFFTILSAGCPGFGQPSNIDNPVLPGVADAGVIRYNGEYFIGGVFTNGSFFRSRDLVKWEGPIHVFSMNNAWTNGPSAEDSQIHANDINYVNGVFHLYWSVNHWGKDQHVVHIGHATAKDVLGPYQEPVKKTWLANRIDPEFFIDDDGTPYLYMVKFTDGNTIWARRMKDPGTFSEAPTFLFSSLPNTWETMDNRVAEGPWVIKYRNRYYMMYNANHTSPRWGNYSLGVAEADAPLAFNNGSKYPNPVVLSNQVDLEDRFTDVLKYTGPQPDTFLFSTKAPEKSWNTLSFDASAWQKGKGGFGSGFVKNSTARSMKTTWQTGDIWLRKVFAAKKDSANYALRIHHDGETTVYLNGQQIYEHKGRQYSTWNVDQKTRSLLKDGENVLAVHCRSGERSNYLDVSLFDMRRETADDILFSPGQPNILRGPNGFEWWLVYMANQNDDRRGQYINRVHFFNKKMFVDAVTARRTPGYHPPPAKPTFSDLFNKEDERDIKINWNTHGGTWDVDNGEFIQKGDEFAHALINGSSASHYLFEAGVKIQPGTAQAGVYAWWQDKNNFLKVVLDNKHKGWSYELNTNGRTEVFSFSLKPDFNYNAYHSMRIFKNAANFTIEIDERPAPGQPVITVPAFSGKGRPGLCSEGGRASFDGVLYTIGWDEFDETITGWMSPAQGTGQKGSWSVSADGISQSETKGAYHTFKGDMLDQYEISVQVRNESHKGGAGIFPVYVDADNFVKALIDSERRRLIVSGKVDGKPITRSEVPLESTTSHYADMRYTDFIEKHFTFDSPACINAINFSKKPHGQEDILIEDIYKKVDVYYRDGDKWSPLPGWTEAPSPHPGFDLLSGTPVWTDALKVVNKDSQDHGWYIYKVRVNNLLKQSYNLRVARYKDVLIFLVDGKEKLRMNHNFPASKVGLVTENTSASFNGITAFHLSRLR